MMRAAETLVDSGILPDWLVRAGIRNNCAARLADQQSGGPEREAARSLALATALRNSAIAIATDAANAQHYEVPPPFFQLMLGPQLKYSCGYWPAGSPPSRKPKRACCNSLSIALPARRATHPRARVRLGLADPVDGRPLSQ